MSIFAIGDLHLSQSGVKTMDRFGLNWHNHAQKIKTNWLQEVTQNDTVLVPGDISWAININAAELDLRFLESLPGQKILLCGNHDYWWHSVSKLREKYPGLTFLQNDCVPLGTRYVCGTRGWLCPEDDKFTNADLKIYNRELIRLQLSLNNAIRLGAEDIILMLHFPPIYSKIKSTGFWEVLKEYPVTQVVYGHLHGEEAFKNGVQGEVEGIFCHLVSSDYVNFMPKLIIKE